VEQLQEVLKSKKPTCAGISASYSCGNHERVAAPFVPQYNGAIVPVSAGDEIAMNSMVLSVVSIDGSGNGEGLIKVPMLNNIKLGVTLSGIQVAEGGCIVAGKAETSGIDVAILNKKQRQNLAKAYEIYKKTLDIAEELAPKIAKGINSVKDNFEALKAKKEATRKLLAQSNLEDLSEVLNNCGEIVSQSRAAQDSLEKTICLIKAGKAKGNIAKLEKASKANIDFINKLGPALAQCQSTTFTPWSELPCKGGPCFEESFVTDDPIKLKCQNALQKTFGIKLKADDICDAIKKLKLDEKYCRKATFISKGGFPLTIENYQAVDFYEDGKVKNFSQINAEGEKEIF
jgi:transcriptional regulator